MAFPPPPFAPGFPTPHATYALAAEDRPPGAAPPPEHWDAWRVSTIHQPTMGYYPAVDRRPGRGAALICPGGGYRFLAIVHEGIAVARFLNLLEFDAFVLKYRLFPHRAPAPLEDGARAICHLRALAPELGFAPNRIVAIGFSAGAHVVGCISTMSAAPDAAVCVYGVLDLAAPWTHRGSRDALLGEAPADADLVLYSPARRISANTPPTLLIHARDDDVAVPDHSLAYHAALRHAGVASDLQLYPSGGHGFGLKPDLPPAVADWPNRLAAWLERLPA